MTSTIQQDNGAVRAFDCAGQPNVRVGDRVRIEDDQSYRSVTRERVAQSHDTGTGACYVLEKRPSNTRPREIVMSVARVIEVIASSSPPT